MNISFEWPSPKRCSALQQILRDPAFLQAYATKTYATEAEVTTRQEGAATIVELVRTNPTDDMPGFLRALIGKEAHIVEATRWPTAMMPCTETTETVAMKLNDRSGLLEAAATFESRPDGGTTYRASGVFALHGVPGLIRGKATNLAAEMIESALSKKFRLADSWPIHE